MTKFYIHTIDSKSLLYTGKDLQTADKEFTRLAQSQKIIFTFAYENRIESIYTNSIHDIKDQNFNAALRFIQNSIKGQTSVVN